MKEVAKFIPMDGTGIENETGIGVKKGVYNGKGGVSELGNIGGTGIGLDDSGVSTFKVCGSSNNLPAKPSIWSKLKGILTYEIKVELTPYQQKIEDEINEFLHQEITWQSVKNFLFQEITFGKKNK